MSGADLWEWLRYFNLLTALGCLGMTWVLIRQTRELKGYNKQALQQCDELDKLQLEYVKIIGEAMGLDRYEEGVQAMAQSLRAILDGGPCIASTPPELAEVARLVERGTR